MGEYLDNSGSGYIHKKRKQTLTEISRIRDKLRTDAVPQSGVGGGGGLLLEAPHRGLQGGERKPASSFWISEEGMSGSLFRFWPNGWGL